MRKLLSSKVLVVIGKLSLWSADIML